MTVATQEPLVCVSRYAVDATLGPRCGFVPAPRAVLDTLLDPGGPSRVLPRTARLEDPDDQGRDWLQLVVYVVLGPVPNGTPDAWPDPVWVYRRGGTEARLHDQLSLGVGGHVAAGDGVDPAAAVRAALDRELAEEVVLTDPGPPRYRGLLRLTDHPVDRVHLGVVYTVPATEVAATPALGGSPFGWVQPETLLVARVHLERWSQAVVMAAYGPDVSADVD